MKGITVQRYDASRGRRVSSSVFESLNVWPSHRIGQHLIPACSVLSLLGLWFVAAALLPSSVMPAPLLVANTLWRDLLSPPIWENVAVSMTRIVLAFALAMSISLVLGFAMGLSRTAERFFQVWIIAGIALPSLVVILLIFMVVGLNDTAAVIAAGLPVVPILTINFSAGIKGVDYKLIDMSKAYHANRLRIIRSVIVPQIAPIILASSRFGLGLIWKMVLFVELLGRSNGIGYQIEFYFQMFNMSEVLAHALLFVIIMLVIEVLLLGALERRLFHWRPMQRRF